jgi:hypothetical protein
MRDMLLRIITALSLCNSVPGLMSAALLQQLQPQPLAPPTLSNSQVRKS